MLPAEKKILLLSAALACLNIPDAKKKTHTHTLKKKNIKKKINIHLNLAS
jgi:hypothetical protein